MGFALTCVSAFTESTAEKPRCSCKTLRNTGYFGVLKTAIKVPNDKPEGDKISVWRNANTIKVEPKFT